VISSGVQDRHAAPVSPANSIDQDLVAALGDIDCTSAASGGVGLRLVIVGSPK
jgi:hypothetical protein